MDDTPKEHIEILKAMLKYFHIAMMQHGLPYFLEGGSLLGAMREKDIIPHDDDIDVGIINKHFNSPNFRSVLEFMKTLKVQVEGEDINLIVEQKNNYMAKIACPGLWAKTENGRIIGTPTLDIFVYEEKRDQFRLASLNFRREFKNCYYDKKELFPLQVGRLGEIECLIPFKPMPYLLRYYGDDCMTVIKRETRREDNPLYKNK